MLRIHLLQQFFGHSDPKVSFNSSQIHQLLRFWKLKCNTAPVRHGSCGS
jgi:hypothetical protein